MRARKPNPYLGQGLDKRQARRARRRLARKVRAIGQVTEAAGFQLEPWQRAVLEHVYGQPPRPPANAARAMTRPRDWASPARAILFGNHTLTDAELHNEIERHAAYGRAHAIEAVRRELRTRGARG